LEPVQKADGLEDVLNAVGRALKNGRLEEAAALLGPVRSMGERETRLSNALAHGLIKEQKFDTAVLFAKRASMGDPSNVERLVSYGWALRKAGRQKGAIRVLDRAANLSPGRVDIKKTQAAWLLQSERLEEAASVAAQIVALEPDDTGHVYFQANILRQLGQIDTAVALLRKAAESDRSTQDDWRRLQSFLLANGTRSEAAELAAEIAMRWPDSAEANGRASQLLLHAGRGKDAVQFARQAVALNPDDAAAHRRLSALLTGVQFNSEAFEHALIAANLEPGNAGSRIFLARQYRRMGRLSDALAELSVALMIDPSSRKGLLDFIELLKLRGQQSNGELVRRRALELYPDDPAFLTEEVAYEDPTIVSMAQNDAVFESPAVTARLHTRRASRKAPATPIDKAAAAIATHGRVIWALLLREVQTRYGKTQLGFVWAFLEPLMHIGMLGVSMAMFRGTKAPLGHYYIVFHFSAIMPYLVFIHATSHLSNSAKQVALLQLPMVQLNDLFIAKGILELVIGIVVSVGLLTGFYFTGYEYMPVNPLGMLLAMTSVWLLGCGIGMINCMLSTKFEAWIMIWQSFSRAFYFISGIFYLPGQLPPSYLKYLIWNPLLHAIDWNRSAFYPDYHWALLSKGYLVGCAVASIFVGLTLERMLRKSALVYQK
jgi:capsular polysaccharide transport system permease protein